MLSAFAGGRLFGEVAGSGKPEILALHGWRRTHRDFAAVVGVGPAALPALALDLPGFGASPPPPEPWGSAEYAAAVAPVVAELGGPAVLLGHSFGGRVAVHLAAAYPDLVRGAVLTGVPQLLPRQGRGPGPALGYRAVRAMHRLHLVSDERMERARRRYGSEDYRQATGVMRDVLVRLLQEDYRQQLQAIRCPVTLVWGERDTAAPLAMAQRAVEHLAHGRLVVCPGVGHLTPLEASDALRQAVEAQRG